MATAPLSLSSLFSVAGKRVLVTGGHRGIGSMFAETFVQNGAHVFISGRKAEQCRATAERLSDVGAESGGTCTAIPADASNNEGSLELAREVARHTDQLDVLINNAGCSWGQPLEDFDEVGWEKVFDLNVKGVFQTTRACLPLLRAAATPQDPGRVINIGSVAGVLHQPWPTYSYDASKAAVHSLTRKLASELAQDVQGSPITVNAIAPGLVPSSMSKQLETYATSDAIVEAVPLGRLGTPEDMGGAATFLASRAGAWVTGAILVVDGGSTSKPISMVEDLME